MNALALIEKASGKPLSQRRLRNAKSVAVALDKHGDQFGLMQPHRLVQYLAQLAHESMGFQYDREVWGPTAAQKRYEGRRDLGNVQKGDGKKFSGHGPIQVTGRANHREFTQWCKQRFPNIDVPDFEDVPEKINNDPWEGLTGVWYWSTRKLNRYADSGDVEMITKRINGGLNGYQDRIDWLVKFSLVALGRAHSDVSGFQKETGLVVDGIAGPQTRAALHDALVALTEKTSRTKDVRTAPVVQDRPTVPESIDDEVTRKTTWWQSITGLFSAGGAGVAGFMGADWQTVAAIGTVGVVAIALLIVFRSQIIAAIQDVRKAVQT